MHINENSRRSFLAAALASAVLAPKAARAQRDWSGKEPVRYPDPDILVLDKRFAKYKVNNTPIRRLRTGMLWAEGPAWSGAGRYLVWSDIPNNAQMRWLEEDGHISTYRNPSGNSNGNTFDYQGRELSCEHLNRRVVRYEPDGAVTVLADKWNGKPLNAPNDIVVHPDGAIWFTDPGYGILAAYEGARAEMQLKEAVYRIDGQTGKLEMVNDEMYKPNGLCFSREYNSSTSWTPAPHIIRTRHATFAFMTWRLPAACATGASLCPRNLAWPMASAPMWMATSGPAAAGWVRATTACRFLRPPGSTSARSCCRRLVRICASAAASATCCSWPPANRCTRCMWRRAGRIFAECGRTG